MMDQWQFFTTNNNNNVNSSSCPHPSFINNHCTICQTKLPHNTQTMSFDYIQQDLRHRIDEINRLRDLNLESLLTRKKLHLVLDLDHTLLHTIARKNLKNTSLINDNVNKQLLFESIDHLDLVIKLRPYVHTFLRVANTMFDMSVFTMAHRSYASLMVKILDPYGCYFGDRVMSREHCTKKHRKGLDVLPCHDRVVLIVDDKKSVWEDHKENLVPILPYYFFDGENVKPGIRPWTRSVDGGDESEHFGELARILRILRRVYKEYFDIEMMNMEGEGCNVDWYLDVREVLRRSWDSSV